jgi:hypothetical protein
MAHKLKNSIFINPDPGKSFFNNLKYVTSSEKQGKCTFNKITFNFSHQAECFRSYISEKAIINLTVLLLKKN